MCHSISNQEWAIIIYEWRFNHHYHHDISWNDCTKTSHICDKLNFNYFQTLQKEKKTIFHCKNIIDLALNFIQARIINYNILIVMSKNQCSSKQKYSGKE
jgi:hypothetical protein